MEVLGGLGGPLNCVFWFKEEKRLKPTFTLEELRLMVIRTARDLREALARIETLWGAKSGTPEGDELDVLADLVEAYENRHHPIGPASGVRALKHLMEANDLSQSDLPEIGSPGVVSEILTGKRDLNLRHVRALAARFKVSPAVFL